MGCVPGREGCVECHILALRQKDGTPRQPGKIAGQAAYFLNLDHSQGDRNHHDQTAAGHEEWVGQNDRTPEAGQTGPGTCCCLMVDQIDRIAAAVSQL